MSGYVSGRDTNEQSMDRNEKRGDDKGGGLIVVKEPSAPSPTLKTPIAFLYEICSKTGATISIQIEEKKCSAGSLFQCSLEVLKKNGRKIEGIAIANNKQNAKHDAARKLLLQLDPGVEEMLTPRVNWESDVQTVTLPQNSKFGKNDPTRKEIPPVDREKGEIDDEGDLVVITSADGTVTVTVPKSLVFQQQPEILTKVEKPVTDPGTTKIFPSLEQTTKLLRAWDGPKIRKLCAMSTAEILRLTNSVRIVQKISVEHGLSVSFMMASKDIHTCILEVASPHESSSDQNSPNELFYLTQSGFGETSQEALSNAARNYLVMIRAIFVGSN